MELPREEGTRRAATGESERETEKQKEHFLTVRKDRDGDACIGKLGEQQLPGPGMRRMRALEGATSPWDDGWDLDSTFPGHRVMHASERWEGGMLQAVLTPN